MQFEKIVDVEDGIFCAAQIIFNSDETALLEVNFTVNMTGKRRGVCARFQGCQEPCFTCFAATPWTAEMHATHPSHIRQGCAVSGVSMYTLPIH